MRSVYFLISMLMFSSAFAFTAKVVEVVPGDKPFAKLDNGEVRFLHGKSMFQVGEVVETETEGFSIEDSTYTPTILQSMETAVTIFEDFKGNSRRRSQCYNRAHVWVYEEFQSRGTKLKKNFMFFTNKYIRNYNYKWWFHVAPLAIVAEAGVEKEYMMDWTHFDEPVSLAKWTEFFVYSGASCATVEKYSQYSNNQEAEDCYFIKTSMYFWQPLDIEAYEKTGVEKTSFLNSDVNTAYRQAF